MFKLIIGIGDCEFSLEQELLFDTYEEAKTAELALIPSESIVYTDIEEV